MVRAEGRDRGFVREEDRGTGKAGSCGERQRLVLVTPREGKISRETGRCEPQ